MGEDDRRMSPEESGEWADLEAGPRSGEATSRWSVGPLAPDPGEGLEAPVNPAPDGDAEASGSAGDELLDSPVAGGRRQARKPGSPRRNIHQVKVTDEAERRLVARAEERGITVSRLLLESALSGGADAARTSAEMSAELVVTNRLLMRLGVNMNQIAAATNATLEEQPEHLAALAVVGRVSQRIEGLLDELRLPADFDRSRTVPGVGAVDADFQVVATDPDEGAAG